MHQHAITVEQFANIHDSMEIFGRVDEGPVQTTIGKHPVLGSCIVLQDLTSEPVLLSEVPFDAAAHAQCNS